MTFKVDMKLTAKVLERIGGVTGIELAHGCACADFRMTKTAIDHLIFGTDEAIVEVDVMSGKNRVAHEVGKTIRDLCEHRCVCDHLMRYPRNSRDVGRNAALRIDERRPLVHHFACAHLDGTDLGHTVQAGAPTRRLDIHDNIGLVRIDGPGHL